MEDIKEEEFPSSPEPTAEQTAFTQTQIGTILKRQNDRRLTDFRISELEKNAKKNWDLFYKANTTNFFKDRHWTLRELPELVKLSNSNENSDIVLLEAGCGVGNFVFPILKEVPRLRVLACDFSPRAVEFVKSNPDYNPERLIAFTCDLTEENCFSGVNELTHKNINLSSLIFVLSAVSPPKHPRVVTNLSNVMKRGGILFFRDYGRHDMAQLRFKPGSKIDENFYVRRDGTRSYYFTPDEVKELFTRNGQFRCIQCEYIHRRTVNLKEELDVGRIFVQGKFVKL